MKNYISNSPPKILATLITCCFIISLLFVPVSANNDTVFSDIDSSAWYYESVSNMVNDGILHGYTDGTFKPNNTISIAEFSVMLTRAFSNSDPGVSSTGYHWSEKYINYVKSEGWLTLGDNAYPPYLDFPVNRQIAVRALISACGIIPWSADLYPNTFFADQETITVAGCDMNYENSAVAAKLIGLVNGDQNNCFMPKQLLTRAEACELIWRAKQINPTNAYNDYMPDKILNLDVSYEIPSIARISQAALGALSVIPQEIIDRFNADGWSFVFTPTLIQMNEGEGVGLTSYPDRKIYVTVLTLASSPETTIVHEIGHYWQYAAGLYFNESLSQAFNSESQSLTVLLNRDYCQTSEQEFFAEAFRAFCTYPADQLAEKIPQTLQLINKSLNNVDS